MEDVRAERLRQALELFEVGEAMIERRLVRQGLSTDERAVQLRAWRHARPHAPHGDGVGRQVDIPRS